MPRLTNFALLIVQFFLLICLFSIDAFYGYAGGEDCSNTMAVDGNCTSCDSEYRSSPEANCGSLSLDNCSGTAYSLDTTRIASAYNTGTRIFAQYTCTCLAVYTCVVQDFEDVGKFCKGYSTPLAYATRNGTESCDK